ncbi:MAG: hypothetical protein IH600_12035 [Bacteroidetes bacterium]|nr:hypothetical protein [Bacteroidota bacterium]
MSRSAANTGPGPTGLVALEQFLPAERYVRPTGRELLSTPLERMVYAERV